MKHGTTLRLSILFLGFCQLLAAQAPKTAQRTEKNYRYTSETDSVLMAEKIYNFDIAGRLNNKQEFYYNLQPAGTLNKEVNASFDSSSMILDENIILYLKNNELETENLKTKYLVYNAAESDSKYIWRQQIDKTGEIVKEDTISYDAAKNMLTYCVYDYRGSTSLYCDIYKYDRKNRMRSWKMYIHWTTVGANSKVKNNRERRQLFRYSYNAMGKPTKTRGRRYSMQFSEDWKYEKSGKLLSYSQRKYSKTRNSKKRRKETNQKFSIQEDLLERRYAEGQLVLEQQTINGKEQHKVEIVYEKDSLPKAYHYYNKGTKIKQIEFFYNDSYILQQKLTYNYDNSGTLRSVLHSQYNEKGWLMSEAQKVKEVVLSRNTYEYDEQGQKISMTMFLKNDNKFEKTLYFYRYY